MFDFFKTKKQYQDVSGQAFKQLLNENKEAVLLDVRTPMEYRQGAIKGAINADIMSGDFQNRLDGLDPQKTYLLYCRSGARSAQACHLMAGKGFKNVYNLSGGIGSYPR
ncbi:rhodanese-like domain-containing protein [Emticicia fluvialis]|uniref:rhodanese-like domain-containing protein n=1 Tax=Emticicia fluvialis TaxID=2974474 RepID=UPI002165C739|nr:rhodanese-like domain-containing protein [Emticicia fluvialis]